MARHKSHSSSSIESIEPPEKRRRKSETLTAPTLTLPPRSSCPELHHNFPSLKTENTCTTRSSTEPTGTNNRLDRIRSEMNNLWEQQREILKDQEQASQQTIKDLELRLIHAHEAQASAESQFAQEKTELHQKISELQNENVKLGEIITQQTTEGTSKLNEAANMIIKLRQKLITCSTPPEAPKSTSTELEKAKMEIEKLESEKMSLWVENQDLLPRATRARELEEELKLADKIIANLRQIVTGRIGDCSEEDTIDIKHEMLVARSHEEHDVAAEFEVLEALEQANESSSGDDTGDFPEDVPLQGDEVSEDLEVPVEQPENERPIWVGPYYVLASHPKFFEIDWKKHYRQKGGRGFACKICSHKSTGRVLMEDHVWLKHYGGRYKCPRCPDYPISWRYDIRRHMSLVHSKDF